MSTDWENAQRIAQARSVKAAKIVAALQAAGSDANAAAHLPPEGRRLAEKAADVRKASDETWTVVVEMLAASSRARALCVTCGLGNPAGEPGPRLPAGHPGECHR